MSHSRAIVALIAIAVGALLWMRIPSAAAARPFETAKVRLFSDGQIVGEWEAVGGGRLEGDTFVFPVKHGVQELDVRIHGTFSVEVQP